MMCQCKFTDCNKCTIWFRMLIVEEAVPGDADRDVGTLCAFAKFFCEPKNALKVVLKTKQTKKIQKFWNGKVQKVKYEP